MHVLLKSCIKTFLSNSRTGEYSIRLYARWAARKPLKIMFGDQNENKSKLEKTTNMLKVRGYETPRDYKPDKRKSIQRSKLNDLKTTDMLETILGKDGKFIYTKMENNDIRVSMVLTDFKTGRNNQELILLEGKRLIKEALITKNTLKYIFFSREDELEYLKDYLPKSGAKLYKMPYRELQMWSDLTTSPGIIGIFKKPDVENYSPTESIPLTIICDNIRDPGNLGGILRAAAGVGCENIIITKGCTNIWDTKVTRGASGAHFRLKITKISNIEDCGDELRDKSVLIADNNVVSATTQGIGGDPPDSIQLVHNLPLIPYYSVKFSKAHSVVLIVGGETTGVSLDSYKVASYYNGVRLNIPLSNNVESLNSGVALGIIAFEIKRQMALQNIDTKD